MKARLAALSGAERSSPDRLRMKHRALRSRVGENRPGRGVGAPRPRYGAAQIVRVMPRSRPSFLTSVTNDLSLPPSCDRIAEKSLS